MRSYEAARGLYSFISFGAWCLVVLGVIAALFGISMANQFGLATGQRTMYSILAGAMPGLGIAFLGLLGLAMAQNGRAAVDTTECTQQMLKIARDQLKISKQALNAAPSLGSAYTSFEPKSDVGIQRFGQKATKATTSAQGKGQYDIAVSKSLRKTINFISMIRFFRVSKKQSGTSTDY